MSKTRKRYFIRLIGRIIIFIVCILLYIFHPESYDILDGWNSFKSFSIFHILWIIWVIDMLLQIIPIKNKLPLGSQKLFANRFESIRDKINYSALKKYIKSTTISAYRVFIIWTLLVVVIGVFYYLLQ